MLLKSLQKRHFRSEIKILEYSFRGDHDQRSLAALQVVLRKTDYDLVSVRGISYRALKHLEPTLLEMGYNDI